jgi:hypothetical protein
LLIFDASKMRRVRIKIRRKPRRRRPGRDLRRINNPLPLRNSRRELRPVPHRLARCKFRTHGFWAAGYGAAVARLLGPSI